MFRTKVTISILEVVLGLLQSLHPDLQLDLEFLTMVPMISHGQGGRSVRAWGPRGLVLGQRGGPKGAVLGGWGDQILAFLVKIEMTCSNRKKRARALKLFVGHQWPKRPTKSCWDYGKLNFHILWATLEWPLLSLHTDGINEKQPGKDTIFGT